MKRRNVLLGLGALAFGSGASSFAAVNNEVGPTGDLQVLADRKLVVRSIKPTENNEAGSPNRSSDIKLEDSGSLPQINTTARSKLPLGYTLNQSSEQNENFAFNAAFEGNGDGGGTNAKFADAFLIENQSSGSRDIQISYKNSDQSNSGYGDDTADTYGGGGSSALHPEEAQQIYKFEVGYDGDLSTATTGTLLSPDPSSETDNHQGANSVTLQAGGLLGIQINYKTTATSVQTGNALHARVNEVATDNIFGTTGAYVDTLDTVYVQDVTP